MATKETVDQFWIVVDGSEGTAVGPKHYSHKEAIDAAKKMASENEGHWLVMGAINVFSRGSRPVEELRLEQRPQEAPVNDDF